MAYKKKNIAFGAFFRLLFPESLWTRRFTVVWLCCLATVLAFDVLWCSQTTFRGLGMAGTWVNALTLSTLMALPVVLTRRIWPQIAVMALVDLLLIANLMYCRTYFNSIPPESYLLVGQVMDFRESIYDSWSWLYAILPAITAVVLFVTPSRGSDEQKPRLIPYAVTLLVFGLLSCLTALASGGLRAHVAKLKGECYYATTPPVVYTVFGTLAAELSMHDAGLTFAEQEAVAAWSKDHMRYSGMMHSLLPAERPDSLQRDNLVVIFCESLESWPVGATLEGKELTPELNKAMSDTATTWYAPYVLSQVGNGRSIDGQLLMLAGMYPTRDVVYSMKYADNRFHALPDAMRRQGATTYLFSGDKPSTWNQGLIARAFGIDRQEMADSWDNSERIGHPARLSDASLMEQTVAKMQRGDVWPEGEKAYVQLVTYSCHNPFRIPDDHRTISFSGKYPEKLTDYLTAVHYTDRALGRLLDYIRSRSDADRTMIVIVGDHEALASWRHELRDDAEGRRLVASAGYIPLIVLNAPVHGVRSDVMGQADVYTTVLDMMGLPYRWRGMGFSALAPESPRFAFDFNGNMQGDATGAPEGLSRHVSDAARTSDIMIRHNLVK